LLQIFGWAGSNMTETNGLGFLSTGLSLWAVGRQRDDEHHDDYGWCGFLWGSRTVFFLFHWVHGADQYIIILSYEVTK
jgi:hypothetical protein